ncbi:MAG: SCO family protein [Verrucomicrobia bacterium]|nr:SCO family protein [Verrucomicrobiota bacterium]
MKAAPSLTRFLGLAAAALALGLVACRPGQDSQTSPGTAETPAEPRYPMTGQVVSVLTERGSLLVDHAAIPGYMPAMTMEFQVGIGDLALAKPGARLRATLIEVAGGNFRLEGVWWENATAEAEINRASSALREETTIRGRKAYREVGENLPDFALYNQEGQVIPVGRWRGKQVMLNFIFTRCTVAAMCPAATLKMMQTQAKAKAAGIPNIEFVSITLDPEFDTPGVLKEYAQQRAIDTTNFSFLTGPESAIKDLFKQFGILTDMRGGVLNHTLATLLINEQGKIVWRVDGSGWSPDDFVAKMAR